MKFICYFCAMSKKRVVIGLSGGVDSSVAAHLLIQAGYEVVGIFMRNWHDESVVINNDCPWIDDSNDAMLVAEHLGIPFQVLDLSGAYKERIVDYMFREYAAGRTPNPDILCNREIKFDVFLKAAEQIGADFVATGHYCRKHWNNELNQFELLNGLDVNKDQSYFLSQISHDQLSKALFPIGHLEKSEVRAIASEVGLPTAAKKDSQGLCFVGKVRLPDFLQQQLKPKEGNVILMDEGCFISDSNTNPNGNWDQMLKNVVQRDWSKIKGRWIGKHQGAHYYTVGQRKGLSIGGFSEPLFVLHTDTQSNTVYVGQGENHKALFTRCVLVQKNDVHLLNSDAMYSGQRVWAQVRYRQVLERATVWLSDWGVIFTFDHPQRAIAEGQFIAFYEKLNENDFRLMGSGAMSWLRSEMLNPVFIPSV